MATTIAGVAMASGGFVLKSVRNVQINGSVQMFSVQNEGDFCVITNDYDNENEIFIFTQIDDISVNFTSETPSLIFGKNVKVNMNPHAMYTKYLTIFEYGPA